MKKYLELIQLVNNSYKHIEQLDTLGSMFINMEESYGLTRAEIGLLYVICKTTQQSHHGLKLNTVFGNPENHVDVVIGNTALAEVKSSVQFALVGW